MISQISSWLPEATTLPLLALLCSLSLVSSALTAATGAGGGLIMLMVLALALPAEVVIPVHGMVQLGSNTGRAWLVRPHIKPAPTLWFTVGAILGTICATFVLITLPAVYLSLSIAFFVLWLCWLPLPGFEKASKRLMIPFAALVAILSMFVGASGPLVTAFFKRLISDRVAAVATVAACMVTIHLLKVFAFGQAGFLWVDWLAWVAFLILFGLAGSWIGVQLLKRVTDSNFDLTLKLILSILAARLVWQSLDGLLS